MMRVEGTESLPGEGAREDGPRRILVVEDDDGVAAFFEKVLSGGRYRILRARDGVEAERLFETGSFDAVVSDIALPNMTGIELLEAARGHGSDVPFVLVTGSPEVESAIRAIEYGALRYLVKPVRPHELKEAVAKAVEAKDAAKMKRCAVEWMSRDRDRVEPEERRRAATTFRSPADLSVRSTASL